MDIETLELVLQALHGKCPLLYKDPVLGAVIADARKSQLVDLLSRVLI